MAQMVEGLNVGFDSLIPSRFILWDPSLRKLFTFSQFMDYYFLLLIHLCINRYPFILRVIALYYIHVFSGSDCSVGSSLLLQGEPVLSGLFHCSEHSH